LENLWIREKGIQQTIELAIQHHNQGRLHEAESLYKQVLRTNPDHPVALHHLGVIARQAGQNDLAVDFITKALSIKPDYADALNNLGVALKDLGRLDEAVASYQRAIAVEPNHPSAHYSLGNALRALEMLDEAISSYLKALTISPDSAKTHHALGITLKKLEKPEEAVAYYHKAIAIEPKYALAHLHLGIALADLGKLDEAISSYQMAVNIKPDLATAHNNLGAAFLELGHANEAISSFRKAIVINPDQAEAHNNLGVIFAKLGRLDEAVASYRQAIAIKSDYAEAHNNLSNALKDIGNLEEAVASCRQAVAIKPDFVSAHSNLLLTAHYCLGHTAKTLHELHCQWDKVHGQKFRATWPVHQNSPHPERRLRVGFLSPNLGQHPVGYFAVGLFENLSKNDVETFVYSDRPSDILTERIKAATDKWHQTRDVSDAVLSDMILADEIDILFDLAGHTADNRLLVFARKPAPLQVSWAGYVGTTGLSSIDYYLSDWASTPEQDEPHYSEKVIRMPDGWLCYTPPDYAPDIGPLPFKRNERITFCSFNNPTKINQEVISIWSEILAAIPNSQLLLKYGGVDSDVTKMRLIESFEKAGTDPSRLILEGKAPHSEFLARYDDVDIALDPFPYSGGLTTFEALWMGIPVITVPGETFASRHSLSHLSVIGLHELVARDRSDYVKIAVDLANNPEKLSTMRSDLRFRMANSPLLDSKMFAANFVAVLREIWRDWCT
jgi:protein O-GlcNAc transferase